MQQNQFLSSQVKPPGRPPAKGMVWIPGGTFLMGSDHHYAEEAPAHPVTVDGFWLDQYLITNAQFQKFVKATSYVTFAERPANREDYPHARPEMLQPSSCVFVKPDRPVDRSNHYNWWAYIPDANWRHLEGLGSSIKGRDNHPVVHVTYEDAAAYANWVGKAFLCAPSYCRRYRPPARMAEPVDTSTCHLGFRLIIRS